MIAVNTRLANVLTGMLDLDVDACDVAVCLASVQHDEPEPRFRRLDLSPHLTDAFREAVSHNLVRYKKEWYKHDLILHPFAVEGQLDDYEVEYLDLSTYDTISKQIEPLALYQGIPDFQEEADFIAGLRFYVIIVQPQGGEPFYFYRRYSHQRMLSRSPYFAMRVLGNQFLYDRVMEPIFLFDRRIDCISHGKDMFILEKNNFYYIFRFFEELLKTAKQILDLIRARDLIHNFDRFAHDCEHDHNKMLKLKNISMQPYLDKITINDMKRVINQYKLDILIVKVGGKEKVQYDPGKDRWSILNLLDDTYLDSAMTSESYQVKSKRGVRKSH